MKYTDGIILEYPKQNSGLYAGDKVFVPDLGRGVVVGFSSISGEPFVFAYSTGCAICVSGKEVARLG